jgi:cysteine dioxygenase
LVQAINSEFSNPVPGDTWFERKARITSLLNKIDLPVSEYAKYTFYDTVRPYTRNLLATDNTNYTLLMLCWSANNESKIHDHPCQGCFIRTIAGTIRESIYSVGEDQQIRLRKTTDYNVGLTSFMNDAMGLHKIGNPHLTEGAISLHLYLPPYKSCKVRLLVHHHHHRRRQVYI